MPWRKEENLMKPYDNYEEKHKASKDQIYDIKQQFEHHIQEIEAAEEKIENELDEEAYDEVAPNTQHIELQDQNAIEEQDLIQIGENVFTEYDIGQDLNSVGTDVSEEVIKNRVSDEDFRKMAQSLNKKQMEFFYHVLKKVKTSNDQLMLFLSGGAGFGKTRLTKCIHQALIRYLNTNEGNNPEKNYCTLDCTHRKGCIFIKWKYNPYSISHSCKSRFPISPIEV
ncbi:unnamed protein product [Mytilus coruscus]|uniref:DNA helicase n=1 Tax=Mytilus coruscus TaxID=42192 RepID=A0A6J8CST0_MYTCO|nr:unnamed protein product [Mytilus coruscus]